MMEVNLYLLVANRGPAKQKAWYGGVLEYETKKADAERRRLRKLCKTDGGKNEGRNYR